MALEWAWLRPQQPVQIADRGLFLNGEGGCHFLFLHGLTGSPSEFSYIARYLRKQGGFTVSCPRLVNHGQPLGILARTSWRELHRSAREALLEAHREARRRDVPLVIGGLSMGAVLCLMLAAEFPEQVAGVACLSPTLFYDGWNVPWSQRLIPLLDYTPLKYFAFFREDAPFGLRNEALQKKVAAQYRRMSVRDSGNRELHGYAHFPVRLFCEVRHLIARCKTALPKVACPVLLVQAERDDMTGPRNSHFIFDRIGSRWRELVLLKESYHVITADLERKTVARHLQRFCQSVIELQSPAQPHALAANDARAA
jgi:carboxylesterase